MGDDLRRWHIQPMDRDEFARRANLYKVRITESDRACLDEISRRHGITISAIMRQVVAGQGEHPEQDHQRKAPAPPSPTLFPDFENA